jgi:hypothetical protein
MKIETIMWLFPIMFMIHDFEEILFMKSWGQRHSAALDAKMPARLRRLSHSTLDLSTPAFAFAVMLIFLTISVATLFSVEYNLYPFWLGMVIVYTLHAMIHIFQSIYLRMYIPALITSILTGGYGVYVIYIGFYRWLIPFQPVALSILIVILVFAVLFPLYIRAAHWFEQFLQTDPHSS